MLNHSCTGLTGVRSPAFAPSVALLVASFKKIWFFSSSLFQDFRLKKSWPRMSSFVFHCKR